MTVAPRGAARGELLDAALRLLDDRPPSAISGREIAEEAGVNYGLVHYHFGSKNRLLDMAWRQHLNWLVDTEMEGGTRPVSVRATAEDRMLWAVAGHMALDPLEATGDGDRHRVLDAYRDLVDASDPDGDPVHHWTIIAALFALELGWPIFGPANVTTVGLSSAELPMARSRVEALVAALEGSVGLRPGEPTGGGGNL